MVKVRIVSKESGRQLKSATVKNKYLLSKVDTL